VAKIGCLQPQSGPQRSEDTQHQLVHELALMKKARCERMEDPSIYFELLKDSPLAVLVGLTIWQLTKVSSKLDAIKDILHQQARNDADNRS
jgi:hypothetical protein